MSKGCLYNFILGLLIAVIIIIIPLIIFGVLLENFQLDIARYILLLSYPLAAIIFILFQFGVFNFLYDNDKKKTRVISTKNNIKKDKLVIENLFKTYDKADNYVFSIYITALFSHTYKTFLYNKFEQWVLLWSDEETQRETMILFNFFLERFEPNDSFRIFEILKPGRGRYKFKNNKVYIKHGRTYKRGNELLQFCFKAKQIMSYKEKSNLIQILYKTIVSKGGKAVDNFALFMGIDHKELHFVLDPLPKSDEISKEDIFESTYFLDLHYQKKAFIEDDEITPNFFELIHQKHAEEYGEKENLYHNLNEKLSKKCQSLLKELVDQQIIFDNEISQKFNPTEITYQRYNKAFKLAHSFGVANILDIDRIESSIEKQKIINEKIILHERLLQEMEEINAALKKLKGTLFEDENKLNDMLSELDVLTENIEKYKI